MSNTEVSRRLVLLGSAVFLSGIASHAVAQARTRVKFAKGNDNTSVDGTIRGEEYHDYLLGAKGGQRMSVSLISDQAYFNILPPGSTGEAIYNSSINGNDATNIVLPKSGDYTIRVYQMGAAADGGRATAYTVSVTIGG